MQTTKGLLILGLALSGAAGLAPRVVEGQVERSAAEEEVWSFRESILKYFGFTDAAAEFLRKEPRLEIEDWSSNIGGATWDPFHKLIRLKTLQQEAAVWAFALAWWDQYRLDNPKAPLQLANAVVRLSKQEKPEALVALARSYVAGDPSRGWTGFFCNKKKECADPEGLGMPDFDFSLGAPRARVQDREMFAGLAAWTMGRHKTGARALPRDFWGFYDPLFTGKIYRTPYYEGGVP